MEQKSLNKTRNKWLRGIAITFGLTTLVAGSVGAVTLDSDVIRNTPFFQRLMITQLGDQTSTMAVEFSGTNGQLIRILPTTSSTATLLAPIGLFIKSSQLPASSFANGSITSGHIASGSIGPGKFNFNITSYQFGGGGGYNNGSCSAGQVATAFSNGTIVCSPAVLASTITLPLCSPGTYFAGRSSIGVVICTSNITLNGQSIFAVDRWQISPISPIDIYFGLTNMGTGYLGTGGINNGTGYIYATYSTTVFPHETTCPCDIDQTNQDAGCLGTGTFTRPYPQYDYNSLPAGWNGNGCFDYDRNHDQLVWHHTNYYLSGSTWMIQMNYDPSKPQYLSPSKRCSCDVNIDTIDCNDGLLNVDYPGISWWQNPGWTYDQMYFKSYNVEGQYGWCYDYTLPEPQFVGLGRQSVIYAQAISIATGFSTTGANVCYTSTGSQYTCDNNQVGVGLNNPLATLHVSSPSTGMTVTTISTSTNTGTSYYTTGPLMGSVYASKLGNLLPGRQCPCDLDPYNADNNCAGGTFYRTYPQYNYSTTPGQSCYDLSLSTDQYLTYPVTVSFASNIFTLTLGGSATTNNFNIPRCSCDNSLNGDCQQTQIMYSHPTIPWVPNDAYVFRGPNQGPACYELAWAGGNPGYPFGPWTATKYEKVMNEYVWRFQFLGMGSLASASYPRCSCDVSATAQECTTPTFVGNNPTNGVGYLCSDRFTGAASMAYMTMYNAFTSTTGIISSTGTLMFTGITTVTKVSTGGAATMRSDDIGGLYSLVDLAADTSAGIVGALFVPYNGPNLYVNGGSVGINNSNPQTAFDVAGQVRFSSLTNPGYDFLAVDNQGYLFTTGNILAASKTQWMNTSTRTGLAGALYYGMGRGGNNVGIGTPYTNIRNGWPTLKLYVDGGIIANNMRWWSDETLKENFTELPSALQGILNLRGYTFQWSEDGREDIGLLAQEVYDRFPNATQNFTSTELGTVRAISYGSLLAPVIEAIHKIHENLQDAGQERLWEQRHKIEVLSRRIMALEDGTRWDGNPGPEIDRGDGQPGPTCDHLERNIDVTNYMTNQPQTNVEYRCHTNYSNHPVNAIIDCGNGQIHAGQTVNGNPFMAMCDYPTPSAGMATCQVEGNSNPSCEMPVNINWEG